MYLHHLYCPYHCLIDVGPEDLSRAKHKLADDEHGQLLLLGDSKGLYMDSTSSMAAQAVSF